MKFQKTKNYIKHKKSYITDARGKKHAPFQVTVADVELRNKDGIRGLAYRNSGHETFTSFDTLEFDFFTEKGVKTFVRKVNDRYYNDVYVRRAEVEYYSDYGLGN